MTDRLAIEELLTVADVCITDYSSLIFEYSLFERPMVFFAYDMENYLDERGFYYPVVPKDQARIRVQVSAAHTREQLDKCIAAFTKIGTKLAVLK